MNINLIAWLFPTLFMIHDFEEIIFVKAWRQKYQKERELSKMKKKPFDHFKSTATFSIGVEIIFLILSSITFLSVTFNSFYIWYGLFFAITSHFVVAHIRLSFQFGHYTPGVLTSLIFLPISMYLLYISTRLLNYNFIEIILSCFAGSAISFFIFHVLTKLEPKLYFGLSLYSHK